MRRLALLLCLASARASAVPPPPASTLGVSLELSFESAEHSRDSNSRRVECTLADGVLTVKETRSGAHSGRPVPEQRRALTLDEAAGLERLIQERGLLSAESVRGPDAAPPSHTVEVKLAIHLRGVSHELTISGAVSNGAGETALAHAPQLAAVNDLVDRLRTLASTAR
jgi:hypothetical protein